MTYNVENLLPYLARFVKAAQAEGLDGFAIAPRWQVSSLESLAVKFHQLLLTISKADPLQRNCFDGDVDVPGWQFEFGGVRLFVSMFAPLFPKNHVRHSASTLIIMQPESSFSSHGVGSGFKGSDAIKTAIRERFIAAGYDYPLEEIAGRVEARIYMLARDEQAREILWWQKDYQLTLFEL